MNTAKHGKTEEDARGYNDCLNANPPKRLGITEAAGEVNGSDQDRFYNCYSSKEDCPKDFDEGDSTVGKILTRLKALESEYSALLSEQEEKLETQLEEIRSRASKLRESTREIEQDIQQLMSGDE